MNERLKNPFELLYSSKLTDINAQTLVLDYEIPSHMNTTVNCSKENRDWKCYKLAKESNIKLQRKLAAYQYDADKHVLLKCAADDHLDAVSQHHLYVLNIPFYEKLESMESSICKSKVFLSDMDLLFQQEKRDILGTIISSINWDYCLHCTNIRIIHTGVAAFIHTVDSCYLW